MKPLTDLLYKIPIVEIRGERDCLIHDFEFDSRSVKAGGLFVAVTGYHFDGHDFINVAIEKGAIAIICERLPDNMNPVVTYIVVKDSAYTLSILSANFFDNPADKLVITGVTGTNGKTTVATLLFHLFQKLGYSVGLISTVSVCINDQTIPASLTTPDPKQLHEIFARMVAEGCSHVFMEVSSHACHQKRVAGIKFKGAIFTNITHDHLDYHETFDNYIKAKKSFFDGLNVDAFALTNIDDKNGGVMVQNCKASIKEYSLTNVADYQGRVIENRVHGLRMYLNGTEVWFRLAGNFNAYNLTAVYGAAIELGLEKEDALINMSSLLPIRGRFEIIPLSNDVHAVVDYAHTPDALTNVLETLHEINTLEAEIITVIGCGGDRDKSKRSLMGRIAAELSDHVIFTSDNPRTEDPNQIITEMGWGVPRHLIGKVRFIENRKEAIAVALQDLPKKAIILVAGKGHETYQEINGVRYPFDDVIEIQKAFHQHFPIN